MKQSTAEAALIAPVTIEGQVVFDRGEVRPWPGTTDVYCGCCGPRDEPHAHIHHVGVAFHDAWLGNRVEDHLHSFIFAAGSGIEGQKIRVTFEVVREGG